MHVLLFILEHLLFFVISSALLVASWLMYLLINNYLDRLNGGVIQEILGTLLSVSLLVAIGLILDAWVLNFSAGLILIGLSFTIWIGFKKTFHLSQTQLKQR